MQLVIQDANYLLRWDISSEREPRTSWDLWPVVQRVLFPVGEFLRDTDMDLNQCLIRSLVRPTATMQVSISALHLHANLLSSLHGDWLLIPVVPVSE